MSQKSSPCICGNSQGYQKCCGLYISGAAAAPTAESLMRSRYTAYTQANIAYIQATMRGKAAERYNPIESEKWAKAAKWKRLKVMRAFADPENTDKAYVEFVAHYIWQGRPQKIHELSVFLRLNGIWYYTERVE